MLSQSTFAMLSTLVAPALVLTWSAPGRLRGSIVPAMTVTLLYGGMALYLALQNVAHPLEWDFGAFRIYGRLAQAHVNFYVPGGLLEHLAAGRSAGFVREVVRVGFPYPPPSMFLFWPLAAFPDERAALAAWYVVQFGALGLAAVMLRRAVIPAAQPAAAVYFCALALVLPAAFDTVDNAQTNFVMLALLAAAFHERRTPRGAVYAALAVFVKPYALALLLVDIALRRGRKLIAYAATVFAAFALALAAFGKATLLTYFISNPASRAPVSSFYEITNQSLLAELLRASGATPLHVSLATQPLFVTLASTLIVATVVLAARLGRDHDDLAFAAALTTGLLVYPATLDSYAMALVIPLAVIWARRETVEYGTCVTAVVSGAVCLLLAQSHAFAAFALVWVVLVAAGCHALRLDATDSDAAGRRTRAGLPA